MANVDPSLFNLCEHIWVVALIVIIIFGIFFAVKFKGSCYNLKEALHHMRNQKKTEGISTIGSFFMALSTRMGAGNIIGIAVAIITGGVGSIFWLWVFSIFGAALCYAECTLGQLFKEKKDDGLFRGGPAYYAEKGLKNRRLAITLSILFVVGGMVFSGMEACNLNDSIKLLAPDSINILNSLIIALVVLFFITLGLKKMSKVLSILTPAVACVWVVAVIIILIFNFQYIPETIVKIIQAGLNFQALAGGLMGSFIIYGFKRGCSSSEGGSGMVASISSSSDDEHPCVQGYVQSLGVFVDIFVICTSTAILLLTCGGDIPTDSEFAIDYLSKALSNGLMGDFGSTFVAIALILITFTTTLGLYTLSESSIMYVFNGNKKARWVMTLIFTLVIFVMSLQKVDTVWTLVDMVMAIMVLFNVYCLFKLRPYIVKATDDYKRKRKNGQQYPEFDKTALEGLDLSGITEWEPKGPPL